MSNEQIFAERFSILENLGSGAMGEVFKVMDIHSHKIFALKVIRKDKISPQMVKRFQRESQLLKKLNHPSIVRVYEHGQYNGQPYFVMSFIEGTTFENVLTNPQYSLSRKLFLFSQVTEAVYYANNHKVTHRDLKPANIMVTNNDRAFVMDFGIAYRNSTMISTKLTQTGMLVGTPIYMSPEQANGKQVNHASDVYTLGVILYQIITGQLPFEGNFSKIIWQIVHCPPKNPRAVKPGIPKDLTKICLKAMQKQPKYRYNTSHEMTKDIKNYLQGKKISVVTPLVSKDWIQRNAFSTLLPAIILLVGLFVLLQPQTENTTNHKIQKNSQKHSPNNKTAQPKPQPTSHSLLQEARSLHPAQVADHVRECPSCIELLPNKDVLSETRPKWHKVPKEIMEQILQHAHQEEQKKQK